MKLSDLKEFVKESKKIFNTKVALPILENVLVKDGYFTFSDLETTYRKKVEINQNFYGLIPFSELEKIVNKVKDCEIDFSFTSTSNDVNSEFFFYDKLKITAGKFVFNFSVTNPNEFPIIKETNVALESICAYDINLIKEAVAFSADDELRPVMNGVFVDTENIVATDSYKLTYNKRKCAGTKTFIIPKKTIKLFNPKNDYSVFTDEKSQNYRFVDSNGAEIIFRCVEGKYPAYRNVIPNVNTANYVFKISKAGLLEALDAALLCCNQASFLLKMQTDFVNKRVQISSQDIDFDKSFSTTISIEPVRSFDDFAIGIRIPIMQLGLAYVLPENILEQVELEQEADTSVKKPKKSKIKEDEMVTFYITDPNNTEKPIALNDNTLAMPTLSIS